MALTTNTKVWKILSVIFILMTLALTILFYFKNIFVTIIIALGLIFVTSKLRLLYRHIFRKRMQSKLLKFLIVCAIILISLIGLYWFVEYTVSDIQSIVSVATLDLPEDSTLFDVYYARIHNFIPLKLNEVLLTAENLAKLKAYFLNEFGTFVPLLTGQLLTALLIIPLVFYIYFRKGEKLMRDLYALVPQKFSRVFKNTVQDTSLELNEYFSAKLIQSAVIALICIIGFSVSGLKAWLFFGLLAGLLNIIPFLGPFLGAIPPLFIALLDPSGSVALGVLITVLLAQAVDNFYLQPFMLSSKIKMEPLILILLVLVFAKLAGALGMILAVPIYSIYKVTLRELYHELVLVYDRKKN